MRHFKHLLLLFILVLGLKIHAWELHYLLTYQALQGVKGVSAEQNIAAESLEDFLKVEKVELEKLLKDYEQEAALSTNYRPLPKGLIFSGNKDKGLSLTQQFLMSLRVNPAIGFPLFILKAPFSSKFTEQSFAAEEIKKSSLLASLATIDNGQALKKLVAGQRVSALEIVASGTEEPDHGMDFNLFTDNPSWFGPLYGLGTQPFGNPLLSYSSQAPFHMGFYYEPPIIYRAAPFLKQCFPEYRIGQFITLSRFAFNKGHPYWGYRFLGIANHYLQDSTQPYHVSLAPGASTVRLIGINMLAMMGFAAPKAHQTQLLTNSHLGLENYQLGYIKNALAHPQNSALLNALKDQAYDKKYEAFSKNYLRTVVIKEAYGRAVPMDILVKKALPKRLLDPKFIFDGAGPGVNLFTEVNKSASDATAQLEASFLELMRSFGSHTRQSIKYVLSHDLGK